MTGISEILVLVLLICGILILPRMFKPVPKSKKKRVSPSSFNIRLRAGIVASILFPLILALVIKPWQGDIILYIFLGIFPVALAWAFIWIMAARKK